MLKSSGRPKGDHLMHFLSWIERPITYSAIWKFSYVGDIIERGPMMSVSFAMDRNKQEGKWLVVECKTLKRVTSNSAALKDHFDGFPWQMRWIWHHFHDYDDCKIGETQIHKIHEQKEWVVWCPHLLHEVLEIWPLLAPNWRCLAHLVKKQPSRGEGLRCT